MRCPYCGRPSYRLGTWCKVCRRHVLSRLHFIIISAITLSLLILVLFIFNDY